MGVIMKWISAAALLAVVSVSSGASALTAQSTDIDLGPMVLTVSESQTAQVFHIVDQLSQWDQYAHKQYVRWARTSLTLTAEDSAMLRRHAALRRVRGWGNGFEQAFIVNMSIDSAARHAIDAGLLTAAEANEEKTILLHFAPKLEPLRRAEQARIDAFRQQLLDDRGQLEPIVNKMARFAGAAGVVHVPVFLVANPDENSGGGEANGGRLVIEVPSPAPRGFVMHESLHFLLAPRAAEIRAAADSAGIPFETLNEAIAYALAPGIIGGDVQQTDMLANQLVEFMFRGTSPNDPYVQSYAMAIVIRPMLRSALEQGDSLSDFLPRAIAAWRRVSPRRNAPRSP